MFVKSVKDFDEVSNEATIIVSDGEYDIMCYCHLAYHYPVGTEVNTIESLLVKNIMRVETNECLITKLDGSYAYHLQGKVTDFLNRIVCIGALKINLDDHFPCDIKAGEYVEFDVLRLDCEINCN